jgi:hypothetical protein
VPRRFQAVLIRALLSVVVLVEPASAAELKQKTIDGFERYVQASESRMTREVETGDNFLWIDGLPAPEREAAYGRLRGGGIEIQRLRTLNGDREIEVPDGLVHHWVGVIFIPGGTIERTLQVLQDYDHHQVIYASYVRRSKLLRHDGNEFTAFLQFYRKTIVFVVLNTEFSTRYTVVGPGRVESRGYSTRIAEVDHPGERDEREKPVGTGRGFLWRLNSYSRVQETDGGVFFQMETIALTRRVPFGWGWLVNPYVERIPKQSLSALLGATRKAVVDGAKQPSAVGDQ